jgi:3-oxoadipate enol-lactonase
MEISVRVKDHTMAKSSGFAEVNGAKLYYEVEGEGKPIVLIHSALMNSKMWNEQVQALSPHCRVIRFDLRGFGQSPMPDTNGSETDDLAQLLEYLAINKAAILGLSMGAEIALGFTLKYPYMVSGLILSGAGLDGFDYSEAAMKRWNAFSMAVQKRNFPAAIDRFMADWVDGPKLPASLAVRQKVRSIMDEYTFIHYLPRPQAAQSDIDLDSERPMSERLDEIKVPTLIIVGDRDQTDILEIAEVLEEGIEGSKRVDMPNAAHFPNIERPREFNRALLDFMQGLR